MIKGLAIDMDGTVYKGSVPIPGAKEFISSLNRNGIPYMFVTNNSSKGRKQYYDKLEGMGFDIDMKNVLTSGTAALRFLKDNRPGKKVYVIGTGSYMEDVREYGIELSDDDPDIVLLSFDRELTYEKINKGYMFIKNGAEYIATHPDDLCPTEDDYDVDIGAFIAMYSYLLKKEPLVIGKPNRLLLDMAAAEMNIRPEDIAMVGDRLYTDMKMAVDNGMSSILVLSGETSEEDLRNADIRPTYVLGSVDEIMEKVFGITRD